MATNKHFQKFLKVDDDETERVYIGTVAVYDVVPELKNIGAKRILILCDGLTRRQREFEILIGRYKEAGFRVFVYCRVDSTTTDRDVDGGLKIYKEYNCDTIIVIGGNADINCAKLVAVRASNPDKPLSYFVGIDRIKYRLPNIVCLATTPTTAISDCFAEYYDTEDNSWNLIISNNLIPAIALLGSSLFVRNSIEEIRKNILMCFCVAIESYIEAPDDNFFEYKAGSINACLELFNSVDKFYNDVSNTYYQEKLLVGGFYAGVASRKTGLGLAKIILNTITNVYGMDNGAVLDSLFPAIIQAVVATRKDRIASLSRSTYFSTKSSDDNSAAQAFIDSVIRVFQRTSNTSRDKFRIYSKDIDKMVTMINKELAVFGLSDIISTQNLYQLLLTFSEN